jgi:hypothetical protein
LLSSWRWWMGHIPLSMLSIGQLLWCPNSYPFPATVPQYSQYKLMRHHLVFSLNLLF